MAKSKKTTKSELKAVKKKNGRYAVYKRGGKLVNGDEKVKFLSAQGLIKLTKPTKKTEAKPEETTPEETSAQDTES